MRYARPDFRGILVTYATPFLANYLQLRGICLSSTLWFYFQPRTTWEL